MYKANSNNNIIKIRQHLIAILISGCALFSNNVRADTQETSDPTIGILASLTNAPGAPGFEDPVRNLLMKMWSPYLSKNKIDGMGNLIGYLPNSNPTNKVPTILIMAHMDEVAFYVKGITADGFLKVQPAGGWLNQVLFAHRWIIMTDQGAVTGYSGIESGHIIPDSSIASAMPGKEDLFIDIGAHSRKEVIEKYKIRPGLPITPDSKFEVLNDSGRYIAKAFDDRAGLGVITNFVENYNKNNSLNTIVVVATTQEEIGPRGAEVIYNTVKPDVVINLEAGITQDFPLIIAPNDGTETPKLGGGPCIFVNDSTVIPNNKLVNFFIKLAEKNGIPYQFESDVNYGEDGEALQTKGDGIPTINISIPIRYAHQDSGIMQRSDYDDTLLLIEKAVGSLSTQQVEAFKP